MKESTRISCLKNGILLRQNQMFRHSVHMVYYLIRVNQNILSDKTQIQGNEEKTKKAKVISP